MSNSEILLNTKQLKEYISKELLDSLFDTKIEQYSIEIEDLGNTEEIMYFMEIVLYLQ